MYNSRKEFEYTYDSDRNLLESRDGVDDLGKIEYDYDPPRRTGRLTVLEYPIEWNVSPTPTVTDTLQREYAYDLANRVTEVRDGETSAPFAEYDYNEASQRTRVDYGNDSYSLYDYDDYGRLELISNRAPNDATMSSFRYSYDLDGLVESVTLETGDVIDYEYDGLSRLTEETKYDDEDGTVWQRLLKNCRAVCFHPPDEIYPLGGREPYEAGHERPRPREPGHGDREPVL